MSSPVTFQAAAAAPSGQTITAMRLYLNSQARYTSSSGTLSTSLDLPAGAYSVVVNAWSNTGAVFQASRTITVGGTTQPTSCTATANRTVQICSPANGATATSPVKVVAGLRSDSGLKSSQIYLDGTLVYSGPAGGTSVNQSFSMGLGSHRITVKGWDSAGSFMTSVTVTVGSASEPPPTGGACSVGANRTVHICAPANNASATNPVNIQAAVRSDSGLNASQIYIDSTLQWQGTSSQVNQNLTLATGTRKITVKGWDSAGNFSSAVYVNVSGGSTGPSVSVTPSSTTVQVGETAQFHAAVTGVPDTSVTWSVDGAAGGNSTVGTIGSSGLYTAPGTAGTHTIKAVSNSDAGLQDTATVNVVTSAPAPSGYFTYKFDNGRTGLNAQETVLTPSNVNSATFGKKGSWSLDANINAQPLWVKGVSINGATRNVLYVATQNDSVYALDADRPGTVLWKRSFLTSTRTVGKAYELSSDGRTSLGDSVGITGTPVIDPASSRLYLVARTTEGGNQVQRLHAIDIRTGNDVVGPAVIQGTESGTGDGSSNGVINFNPLTQNQRPGLLLSNGVVYITFAAFSDFRPYHGWVIAYSASNLGYIDAYAAVPDGSGGGIWQSGAAPAADGSGNVYVVSSNSMPWSTGIFNPPRNLSNSVIKLSLVNGQLTLTDYFAPYNTVCLTRTDLDLGSAGAMLVPGQINGKNVLAFGSKEGRAYLVDRGNMGKFQSGSDSQIIASVLFNSQGACGQSGFDASSPWRVYGSTAYWKGNLYFGSVFGPLRQYDISGGTFRQVALSSHVFPGSGQSGRGAMTVVSSNGDSNGIVWTAERDLNKQGWLRAYDANNVGRQLYVSNFGAGTSFVVPTVINGRVYVTGENVVYMYGLL